VILFKSLTVESSASNFEEILLEGDIFQCGMVNSAISLREVKIFHTQVFPNLFL